MTVTMKQVRQHLDPEEPNYPEAAKLGSEAIPHLEALVRSAEPMLASKATFLASMILSEGSEQVVRTAAQSPEAIVRVAAAAAVRNLRTEAAARLMPLLSNDTDEGVRKVAARALIDDDENTLVPAAKTKARRGKESVAQGADCRRRRRFERQSRRQRRARNQCTPKHRKCRRRRRFDLSRYRSQRHVFGAGRGNRWTRIGRRIKWRGRCIDVYLNTRRWRRFRSRRPCPFDGVASQPGIRISQALRRRSVLKQMFPAMAGRHRPLFAATSQACAAGLRTNTKAASAARHIATTGNTIQFSMSQPPAL